MFKVKTKKRRLKKSVKFAILLLIVIIVLLLCKPLFNKNETNKEDSNKTETKLPNNKTDELVKKVDYNMVETSESDKEIIKQCYEILTSDNLKENMEDVTKTYVISTKVNLTNKMFNPVSWLGQATCNLLIAATARETCQAWLTMTKEQQLKAKIEKFIGAKIF